MTDGFTQDAFVKIVLSSGEYRYGYVDSTQEDGDHLLICLHDEGESKLAFDTEEVQYTGGIPRDWSTDLTAAERRLLPYLARGMSNKEIGLELGRAHRTIVTQVARLRAKLQLQTRPQLTVMAQGLVQQLARESNDTSLKVGGRT